MMTAMSPTEADSSATRGRTASRPVDAGHADRRAGIRIGAVPWLDASQVRGDRVDAQRADAPGSAGRPGISANQCSTSPVTAATVEVGMQNDDSGKGWRLLLRLGMGSREAMPAAVAEVGCKPTDEAHFGVGESVRRVGAVEAKVAPAAGGCDQCGA